MMASRWRRNLNFGDGGIVEEKLGPGMVSKKPENHFGGSKERFTATHG
jgi:hypothetical protein